jgi:hypothetical protein
MGGGSSLAVASIALTNEGTDADVRGDLSTCLRVSVPFIAGLLGIGIAPRTMDVDGCRRRVLSILVPKPAVGVVPAEIVSSWAYCVVGIITGGSAGLSGCPCEEGVMGVGDAGGGR